VTSSAELLACSPGLSQLVERIARVALAPRTTVLIHGESGSGKELVARSIHELSPRRDRRFVALNCAALTEGLLEAELFGYEGGAFTGGDPRGREGLLHAAEGGTLVFDEIGELALGLQAKLLRALQERVYRRVGAGNERAFDVRVIASTHRDLGREVAAGRFREDLFYRLNVLSLTVPALRERPQDILPLARRFLARANTEFGREISGLSPAAVLTLERHTWPGNVRELENTLQRAALLCTGSRIEVGDLALGTARISCAPDDALPLGDRSLRTVEQNLILRVLEESAGNRSRAASVLGINRTTLYAKLKTYGIHQDQSS
jgi:transcriptional regulator with PAS, ATPase and Fis domain